MPSSIGLQLDLTGSVNPDIVLIVAVADNGVIGRGNALPWQLSSDLKRFKALTLGRPVIMGRKTHQSIGRPLPGRTNIVLTRHTTFRAAGVVTTHSPGDAMAIATGDAARRGVDEIAVIGGAEIYALFVDRCRRIELTRVHLSPEGDATFATPDARIWAATDSGRHPAGLLDSADFTYVRYRRRAD